MHTEIEYTGTEAEKEGKAMADLQAWFGKRFTELHRDFRGRDSLRGHDIRDIPGALPYGRGARIPSHSMVEAVKRRPSHQLNRGHDMNAITYTRAAAVRRMNSGPALATRKDGFLYWLSVQAKHQRIQYSGMNYRMRLAAIIAADSRKGRAVER